MSTLRVSPLPRGSEDSEQDSFPFTSGAALRRCRGQACLRGEGWASAARPVSPGVWDLSGEDSDKPGAAGQRGGLAAAGNRGGQGQAGWPCTAGLLEQDTRVLSKLPHDPEGQMPLLLFLNITLLIFFF